MVCSDSHLNTGTTLRAGISATTFTMVGVACKVITELLNIFMWDKHANELGLVALAICLLGSILFVPSQPRTSDSWISNKVWDKMNVCNLLKRCELESPLFHEDEGKPPSYQPVATADVPVAAVAPEEDAKLVEKV